MAGSTAKRMGFKPEFKLDLTPLQLYKPENEIIEEDIVMSMSNEKLVFIGGAQIGAGISSGTRTQIDIETSLFDFNDRVSTFRDISVINPKSLDDEKPEVWKKAERDQEE